MKMVPQHRDRCRRLRRTAGLAATITFFAGCTAGPDYVRPPAATPVAYKEAQAWKIAQPGDAIARGKWWELYGDAELDALVAEVDLSNQTIAGAEARLRQARALAQAARAAYFPFVSASGVAARSQSSAGGGRVGIGAGGTIGDNFNVGLDARWEIDLWGRIRRSVEAGDAGADASAADVAAAKLAAQAELAQNYLLLRVQDATVALLQESVAGYQRSSQLTRNQFAVGVVGRVDVVQAEVQLKSTQAQVLDAGVQRAQLEHAIAVLIGKAPAELSIPAAEVRRVFPEIPLGLPSALLERRPDIAAAERRVAAANAQIGVAAAAFFPSLTLTAGGGFQNSVIGDLLSLPSRYWALGPALAQTLFDAGLRRAQSAQAVAVYDQTVAAYRQTVLTSFREVEDNLAALHLLAQEAALQDDAVKAAREAVAITINQYKAGTTSYLAVVVLQTAALNSERTALAILGRRLTASVGLIRALGGGWNAASPATAP